MSRNRFDIRNLGSVQKSPSSKAVASFTRSVLVIREHGRLATCLREAASAGMELQACQP